MCREAGWIRVHWLCLACVAVQVDVLPGVLTTLVGMCKLFHLQVAQMSVRFHEQVRILQDKPRYSKINLCLSRLSKKTRGRGSMWVWICDSVYSFGAEHEHVRVLKACGLRYMWVWIVLRRARLLLRTWSGKAT